MLGSNKEKKLSLNLTITPEVKERLGRLQQLQGASSAVEVVRHALAVYELILVAVKTEKKKVFLRDEDGKESIVVIA